MDVRQLGLFIHERLPRDLKGAWDYLRTANISGSVDRLEDLGSWLAAEGPRLGIRAPNARERARALGVGTYATRLDVSDTALFNATSKATDGAAFLSRTEGPLAALFSSTTRGPPKQWPPEEHTLQTWTATHAALLAAGVPPDELIGPAPIRANLDLRNQAAQEAVRMR